LFFAFLQLQCPFCQSWQRENNFCEETCGIGNSGGIPVKETISLNIATAILAGFMLIFCK
jgi:hypothetical protein